MAADQDLIRAANRRRILAEIRKSAPISRVELVERAGQSPALVTNITAELLAEDLIRELEPRPAKARGRRRVFLELNPGAVHAVGVKVSGHQVSFAVTDFTGEVRHSLVMPVRTLEKPVAFLADLVEEGIRHCAQAARLSLGEVAGVGVAIPGFVDARGGVCLWSPLFREAGFSMPELLEPRLGLPVHVENDANAVTLAEQWFGLGVGLGDFLVVSVEQGVGMGIVAGGELYRGASGIGAEFGHMVLDPQGPPCACGKRGCVEAYAGGRGIMRAALEAHATGTWRVANPETLTVEDLIVRARAGDVVLRRIFRRAGEMLGRGVAGLFQIFNPARLILTGEYAQAGDILFGPMRRTVKRLVNPQILKTTDVVVQQWEDTAWARGAATLVLQALHGSPPRVGRRLP